VDDDGALRHRLINALTRIHAKLHLLDKRGPLTAEQRELLDGAIAGVFEVRDLAREAFDGSRPDR
jgi:hypothetical protein